jgi:hypothetical protein
MFVRPLLPWGDNSPRQASLEKASQKRGSTVHASIYKLAGVKEMASSICKIHRNTFLLDERSQESCAHHVLLMLNAPPSTTQRAFLKTLWKNCYYRICCDGGANRLHALLCDEGEEEQKSYVPNLIIGDLDSLQENVRTFYE